MRTANALIVCGAVLTAAVAVTLASAATSGTPRDSTVRLTVSVREYTSRFAFHPFQPYSRWFSLRCNPPGGNMPHRAVLCKLIAAHRSVMLPRALPDCDWGPPGHEEFITVVGTDAGRRVSIAGSGDCGPAAHAYWAAVHAPRFLPAVAAQVLCVEHLRAPATLAACMRDAARKGG